MVNTIWAFGRDFRGYIEVEVVVKYENIDYTVFLFHAKKTEKRVTNAIAEPGRNKIIARLTIST